MTLYQTEIAFELLALPSCLSSLISKINGIIPEVSAVFLISGVLVIRRRPPLIDEITGKRKVERKKSTRRQRQQ